MLVAMHKIDGSLFDELHDQFQELDVTGNGQIMEKDLKMMAKSKMRKVRRKLELRAYKVWMLSFELDFIQIFIFRANDESDSDHRESWRRRKSPPRVSCWILFLRWFPKRQVPSMMMKPVVHKSWQKQLMCDWKPDQSYLNLNVATGRQAGRWSMAARHR